MADRADKEKQMTKKLTLIFAAALILTAAAHAQTRQPSTAIVTRESEMSVTAYERRPHPARMACNRSEAS